MGHASNILCPRCKEQDGSHPQFIFYYKLSKITLQYISEIINLNYTFNTPFKLVSKPRAIIMRTLSQSHDGVHLKILVTLLEVLLRHLYYCCRKAFHEDAYDKIIELSNFKCNPVSRFNKLRGTATDLG